jgi:hypothetical protein
MNGLRIQRLDVRSRTVVTSQGDIR